MLPLDAQTVCNFCKQQFRALHCPTIGLLKKKILLVNPGVPARAHQPKYTAQMLQPKLRSPGAPTQMQGPGMQPSFAGAA